MYNIIQLNDKELPELQTIAKELGVKDAESLQKVDLVYAILDEQAVAKATQKAASDKNKEAQPRKRSRISVKKEGDKVYTATQDKATKLEAKTPEIQPKPLIVAPTEKPVEEEKTEPVVVVETPVEEKEIKSEEKPAPKKRGRKSKAQKEAEAKAAEAETIAPITET